MSWLKAVPSPQNNADINAPRFLGVSYFNCQIHCLHGGLTINLHKHQTDGKPMSAGELRGCPVIGCHSSKVLSQVYFGSWRPLCFRRILLTDHHRSALPCFLAKWMLWVTLWIYPKGHHWFWCLLRGCSLSPLLSHLLIWQNRSSLMQHVLKTDWDFSDLFLNS